MSSHATWKDTQIKYRIVDKYYETIDNYFLQLTKLAEENKNVDIQTCMMIGMNVIHRVFEYVLMRTKNIEKAYYYAERAYIYYIEYMEQIHKTNLHTSLNQGDAILFVYKKTIFELEKSDDKVFDTITNIMTFDEEITKLNNKEYSTWMSCLFTMIQCFFAWSNTAITFRERTKLSKTFLKQYMHNVDKLKTAITYLEFLHERLTMQYSRYNVLLMELLKFNLNNTTSNNNSLEEEILLKFFVEKNVMYENYENNDMKELVKWLYSPLSISN